MWQPAEWLNVCVCVFFSNIHNCLCAKAGFFWRHWAHYSVVLFFSCYSRLALPAAIKWKALTLQYMPKRFFIFCSYNCTDHCISYFHFSDISETKKSNIEFHVFTLFNKCKWNAFHKSWCGDWLVWKVYFKIFHKVVWGRNMHKKTYSGIIQ